jgi:hypothetical protein
VYKLNRYSIPKHQDATYPGLPFPGKWPTRWYLEFVDPVRRFEYLGKPSRGALSKLIRLLRISTGPVVAVRLIEFDRSGRVFRKIYGGPGPNDVMAWLQKGHTASTWMIYHAWDQKNLFWILQPHKTMKIQTDLGVKRLYMPTNAGEGWQDAYRKIISVRQRALMLAEEYGVNFR